MNPMIPAIAGGIFGLAGDALSNSRNKAAAEQQYNNTVRLMNKSQEQQYEMWKKTNYGAQVEQMNKAGINPALLYGMSGGGATTTGSSSGSAAMAAPASNSAVGGMGMGIELGLMQAQKENIEADTENKKADAVNKGASAELTGTQNRLAKIEEEIKGKTKEDAASYIIDQARLMYEEVMGAARNNQVGRATVESQIKTIQETAIGAALQNRLTKENINLTKEQITKISNDIAMGWEDLSQRERRIKLDAWKSEMDAQQTGIGEVWGRIMNDVLEDISDILINKQRMRYKSPENKK